VIVSEATVNYEFDQPRVWYQVLTGGRTVWVDGGVRCRGSHD